MPKLPEMIDFEETQHPGLSTIFREIDSAISAIIASDPAFRARQIARRPRSQTNPKAGTVRVRSTRRVAA